MILYQRFNLKWIFSSILLSLIVIVQVTQCDLLYTNEESLGKFTFIRHKNRKEIKYMRALQTL